MGCIRLLLALAVLVGHSTAIFGYTAITGRASVQAFYMVSGFYMAMVYAAKYKDLPKRLFYLSRYLRIMPLYWVVLISSVVFYHYFENSYDLKISGLLADLPSLTLPTLFWLFFTNLTLIGIDSLFFLGINERGSLFFTSEIRSEQLAAYHFSIVPQAWSLGIELLFYVFVPFIFRLRTRWIVAIACASMAARILFYSIGDYLDPWTYRFFGFEIAIFLAGGISYRLLQKLPSLYSSKMVQYLAFAGLVTYILIFRISNINEEFGAWIFNSALLLFLPAIFLLTKNSRLDYALGQLSYPIYVIHYIVIVILNYFNFMSGLTVAIVTILLSIAWYLLFDLKIEKIRSSLTKIYRPKII